MNNDFFLQYIENHVLKDEDDCDTGTQVTHAKIYINLCWNTYKNCSKVSLPAELYPLLVYLYGLAVVSVIV